METIGSKIRKHREDKKLSQNKLAALSSLSPEYIGKVEREEITNIGLETLQKITAVLDLKISDLFN